MSNRAIGFQFKNSLGYIQQKLIHFPNVVLQLPNTFLKDLDLAFLFTHALLFFSSLSLQPHNTTQPDYCQVFCLGWENRSIYDAKVLKDEPVILGPGCDSKSSVPLIDRPVGGMKIAESTYAPAGNRLPIYIWLGML